MVNVDELKAQHGDVVELSHAGRSIIVKRPSRAVWRKFQAKARGPGPLAQHDALEGLVRDCLVHPDPAGFDAMLEALPGLVATFGGELVELAGVGASEKKAL